MKKGSLLRFTLLGVPLAGVLFFGVTEKLDRPVRAGEAAPTFTLESLQGEPVELSRYRGRVVVLNFWATWCPPCVTEMPSLERLSKLDKVTVLTVSVDRDLDILRNFVAQHGLTLTVARDPERRLAARYGTYKYPETYILGPNGKVHDKMFGAVDWDQPNLRNQLLALARNAGQPQ